jgi:hypothetical protein
MRKLFLIALPAAMTFFALPAQAQDAGERVNQLVVYGDDPCPSSSDGEIVVCARKDEGERYRIPESLRGDPDAAVNQAWTERVRAYEYVGKSGTMSCSPVGAGGFTGCTQNLINQAYAEKAQGDGVNWAKLIEDERQKRLDRIDAESEAVEARVLEIEAQREQRAAAEAEAQQRMIDEATSGAPPPSEGNLLVPPSDEPESDSGH